MSHSHTLRSPASTRDRSLPYTYIARVHAVPDAPEFDTATVADTICALIERLDAEGVAPDEVDLFAEYLGSEIRLDVSVCVDEKGAWLTRPELCHALEEHFRATAERAYKGHDDTDPCSFTDRERRVL